MLWLANHTIKTDRSLSRITNKPIGMSTIRAKSLSRKHRLRLGLTDLGIHGTALTTDLPPQEFLLSIGCCCQAESQHESRHCGEQGKSNHHDGRQDLKSWTFLMLLKHFCTSSAKETDPNRAHLYGQTESIPSTTIANQILSIIKLNRELDQSKKLA